MRISFTALLMLAMAACPEDNEGPKDTTDVAVTETETPTDTTPDSTPTTVPTDASSSDSDTVVGCGQFTLSGTLTTQSGAFVIDNDTDLGFGGPQPDALVLEFLSNDTGTFDLGLGANANYGTCKQCVRIVQDRRGEGAVTKQMFANSGKIIIDEATPPDGANLRIELVDMTMVEVKIFADFHSEEVDNGQCYESQGSVSLQTADCIATCDGRACGSDGCDGTCGSGCKGDEACTLDGQCVADPPCFQLALPGGVLDNQAAGVYQLDTTSHELGAIKGRDFLQLEFYAKKTGSIDLAAAPNNDYSTCTQCVRMVIDDERDFFQSAGTMVITENSEPIGDPDATPPEGTLNATLTGVRLVEVTYDEEFHATPVEGGACIDIVSEQPFTKE